MDRHKDGDICRDGLDKFLEEFDLDAYEPTIRVRFTISGSYLVRDSSERDATNDGQSYLGIDLSRLDNVVDSSEDFDVVIESADETTTDDD